MENRGLIEVAIEKTEAQKLRFAKVMISINDPELRLIKAHLLIEEALYKLALFKLKKATSIEKARLTFAQLLSLVEALYYQEELFPEWLVPATFKLNKIRNLLAHNLNPENLDTELKNLTNPIINELRKNGPEPSDCLMYALGNIHAAYLLVLEVNKELGILHPSILSMSFPAQCIAYEAGVKNNTNT